MARPKNSFALRGYSIPAGTHTPTRETDEHSSDDFFNFMILVVVALAVLAPFWINGRTLGNDEFVYYVHENVTGT
jgi:hypothetical protein